MALIGAWTFVDLSIDTKHITPTVREMPFPIKSKVSSYIYIHAYFIATSAVRNFQWQLQQYNEDNNIKLNKTNNIFCFLVNYCFKTFVFGNQDKGQPSQKSFILSRL